MRVVVTGAAGFIGFHVCAGLLSRGYEVVGVDNLSRGDPSRAGKLESMGCEFVVCDVRERERVLEALRGADAVVHCAALVSTEESFEKPLEYESVNVGGTVSVLEAASGAGVRRFVYLSSAAVYGDPEYLPIDEDHPTRPKSPYGASKLAGEVFTLSYARSHGLSTAILRLFNVYGPGQSPEYAGVISRFAERLRRGLPPVIYGDGEQTRDFVHVVDVVRAVEAALALELDNAVVVNVGSGVPTTINRLAEIMIELAGLDLEPEHAPPRLGDIRHSYADISRARRVLR